MHKTYTFAIIGLTIMLFALGNSAEKNPRLSNDKEVYQLLPLVPFQQSPPIKIASIKYKEEIDRDTVLSIATVRIKNISEKTISGLTIVAISTNGMGSGKEITFENLEDNIHPQGEVDILSYIDSSKLIKSKNAEMKERDQVPFQVIYPVSVKFSDGTLFDDSDNYSKLKKFLSLWGNKK